MKRSNNAAALELESSDSDEASGIAGGPPPTDAQQRTVQFLCRLYRTWEKRQQWNSEAKE